MHDDGKKGDGASASGSHRSRPPCGGEHGELVQIGLRTGGPPQAPLEATRRDLLSLMGFSLSALGLGGCRAPVQHAVPLPVASDQIVPGLASTYATTCGACPAACALLVKQRDGRPIKIEGNDASPLTGGGTCAAGQASVLSLYDQGRLDGPVWLGAKTSWSELDRHVGTLLEGVRREGRRTVLLSSTVSSPSVRALVAGLGRALPRFSHVTYEPMSLSAVREANRQAFGAAVVPHYRFDLARVIVGLEADFLGTWLAPVEFARQYARGRRTDGPPSFHVQLESGMSVTGSNADLRLALAPSELGPTAVALLAAVAARVGRSELPAGLPLPAPPPELDRIADALVAHRGQSLVVSGSDDPATQLVVAALNALLDNVGTTIDIDRPSLQSQGDDAAMAALIAAMERGEVGALIVWGPNPVYDHPAGARFKQALARLTISISLNDRLDETSRLVNAVCPDHHFLESWGDAEPVTGHLSLRQPLVAPLHDTRSAVESLLRWAGRSEDHRAYLRDHWRTSVLPAVAGAGADTGDGAADAHWDEALERGVVELPLPKPPASRPVFRGDWKAAVREILAASGRAALDGAAGQGYELQLTEGVAVRDGRHANNPWLLELPDPVTKLCWGNAAALAPAAAGALGVADGDLVTLRTDAGEATLPVLVQPGQNRRSVSVAVGYGRTACGRAGDGVGIDVYPLVASVAGRRPRSARVTVTKVGGRQPLTRAQLHFSMEGRPIVQQEPQEDGERPSAGGATHPREPERTAPDLWRERLHGAHSWGMAIDLDACTGCSACVIACQAENNVPVVGPAQVRRSRIMHWLRIDRYYEGPDTAPVALHQPMMCQHCGHAPCETVCPVLATTTSSEGINQQVYNRCIGTRYCANNCPYKVRRFNWHHYTADAEFDFGTHDPTARLVLNPDVTVRSRGVMEKCSLCVQRIQLGKNTALREGRALADGDVRTACAQSCPTGAIVFGDLADPRSRVAEQLHGPRAYRVLEELGTRPNVGYLRRRVRRAPPEGRGP
jgi:molybdopterin-containing oxidoreductase family iron-sulfur binding subunit